MFALPWLFPVATDVGNLPTSLFSKVTFQQMSLMNCSCLCRKCILFVWCFLQVDALCRVGLVFRVWLNFGCWIYGDRSESRVDDQPTMSWLSVDTLGVWTSPRDSCEEGGWKAVGRFDKSCNPKKSHWYEHHPRLRVCENPYCSHLWLQDKNSQVAHDIFLTDRYSADPNDDLIYQANGILVGEIHCIYSLIYLACTSRMKLDEICKWWDAACWCSLRL